MNWRIPVWAILMCGLAAVVLIHIYFDQSVSIRIDEIGREIGLSLDEK